MFYLAIWFQRECGEAPLSVAIIGPVLQPMMKSEAGNDMEAKFLRTSGGGLSLCGDVELDG
jgi:hypothetical protein